VKLAYPHDTGPRCYVRRDALPYKLYSYRGRMVDISRPVEVYRNLARRDGVWYSVRQGGHVVAHAQELMLNDASFVVHEAGRQRVLSSGRKNVHAWVRGTLIGSGMGTCTDRQALGCRVRYNPREAGHFYWLSGTRKHPIKGAMVVMIRADGVTGSYFH
jgi:hypothetical protein